eukprot:6051155-Prymnesium_polylepis.1
MRCGSLIRFALSARADEFWREMHKERVKQQAASRKAKKMNRKQRCKLWLFQSANQIQAQHKLFRVFL